MGEVPPAPDIRPGWQQVAGTPWRAFRGLPAWAQMIGWLVGFWILPAAWLFARAKGPAGVAGAVAAAAFGLVVVASASAPNDTTGSPAVASATAEPAPTPTVAAATSPTPELPSPTPSLSMPPPPTPSPMPSLEPPPSPTPSATLPPDNVAGSLPAGGQATTVERIVDGDTLYLAGLGERARLIGIDTPETVAPNRPIECFGPEASARLAELVPPGTEVVVTRDVELFDRYDRPLIYLYRASDGLFINEAMLADGFAQLLTYPPNVAHVDAFQEAQRVAREAGNGLWGASCSDDEGQEQALASGGAASEGTASGGAASGSGDVVIAQVNWDGPGNDVEFNTSEHIVLRNDSDAAVDVGGWSLTDAVDHRIVIPASFVIPPGGELRVHTGPGDQADDAHHDGQGQAIWNNSGGDTVTLRDAAGTVIDEQSYSS